MNDRLFILHDDVVDYTEEELANIETALYDLSDELYNYVVETNTFIEEWNAYSDTFETEEFATVFSCANVEINLKYWTELVKNRNVLTLSKTLVKDVNEIYAILSAIIEEELRDNDASFDEEDGDDDTILS